jgi:hypothetical protein
VSNYARKALPAINHILEDRDEWKQQHENLLAMYRRQTDELARLKAKCAHCPSPAVVDITLGDPINYSLCQRCADLEDSQSDASGDDNHG